MHAFLIVGRDEKLISDKASELARKLKAKLTAYGLKKIDDVRGLNKLTRLSVTEPTAIYIKGINEAGEEALNAFLKNLEEPQENLYYILSAPNLGNVLPTIASRCQVISTVSDQPLVISTEIEKFLKMKAGARLAFVETIRDRGEAIKFIEEFISAEHDMLHESENLGKISNNLEVGLKALASLKANGNVSLQLANFVINLV